MVPIVPEGWSCPVQGWAVTIRGLERLEEPHVTIKGPGGLVFRFGLRSWDFLDDRPQPRQVPPALIQAIRDDAVAWKTLWNRMYPKFPIETMP